MKTVHIMQSSLQFNVNPSAQLDFIFNEVKPDVVGFTEAAPHHLRPAVMKAARRQGYEAHGANGDTVIAVAPDHEVLDFGSVLVNPTDPRPAAGGGHGPRYVDWIKFDFDGERIFHHEAHWVTQFAHRPEQHRAMTEAMIENVQKHGTGRRLSFFGGDVNISERRDTGQDHRKPDFLFNAAGLTTVWDELDTLRGTHGGATIDVIGSYDKDRRVMTKRVKVYDNISSDHRSVSAWFNIDKD